MDPLSLLLIGNRQTHMLTRNSRGIHLTEHVSANQQGTPIEPLTHRIEQRLTDTTAANIDERQRRKISGEGRRFPRHDRSYFDVGTQRCDRSIVAASEKQENVHGPFWLIIVLGKLASRSHFKDFGRLHDGDVANHSKSFYVSRSRKRKRKISGSLPLCYLALIMLLGPSGTGRHQE
jgi:hypothetical protein